MPNYRIVMSTVVEADNRDEAGDMILAAQARGGQLLDVEIDSVETVNEIGRI